MSKKNQDATKESTPDKYRGADGANSIPGVNTPGVELPAFNPPVPNRAWTAMKEKFENYDMLTPEERKNLKMGIDGLS